MGIRMLMGRKDGKANKAGTGFSGHVRALGFTVGLLAATAPVTSVAAVLCSDDVLPADQAKAVRVLQSELMVAALACDARHHYGSFVTRYKSDLVHNGKRLKRHFHAAHGAKKGFAELNRFVTRMANKASGRMASLGPQFCDGALKTYDQLLTGDGVELAAYSISYANRIVATEHGSETACGADRVAVAPSG